MTRAINPDRRCLRKSGVIVVLSLAVLLAACGGDDSDASPATDNDNGVTDEADDALDAQLGALGLSQIEQPTWFPDDLLLGGTRFYEADNQIGGRAKVATAAVDEPDPTSVASAVKARALENGYDLAGQNGATVVSVTRADIGSIILEFKPLDDGTLITIILTGAPDSSAETDEPATSSGTASITLDGSDFDVAGTCAATESSQQFASDDGKLTVQFDPSTTPATVSGSYVGEFDGDAVSLNFDSGTPLGAKIESSKQANGFVLEGPMLNQFDPVAPPFDGVVSVVCGA